MEKINLNNKRILAVHIYDSNKIKKLIKKLTPIIPVATEIWISYVDDSVPESALSYLDISSSKVSFFKADNKWLDWSGYRSFFKEFDGSGQLIVCNDSIVSRRVMSRSTIDRFVSELSTSEAALIGELDASKRSVDLNGWASVSWISTYLFALNGFNFDFDKIEGSVEKCVEQVRQDQEHYFNYFLKAHRANILLRPALHEAKLGTMFFERYLSKVAVEKGTTIINFTSGSIRRKIERILERIYDS
jgi:hypothetical protein